jgi:hypothetical protein
MPITARSTGGPAMRHLVYLLRFSPDITMLLVMLWLVRP